MKLHPAGTRAATCLELLSIWIHKQAHGNPTLLKLLHLNSEGWQLPRDIKAAFGGDLLTPFRHKGDHVGLDAQGNGHHLSRCRHFKIQARTHRLPQKLNITILDMTPVFTQVNSDAISTSKFGKKRMRNRVGFNRSARLTDVRDVIDIDAEAGHLETVVGRILCSTAGWI